MLSTTGSLRALLDNLKSKGFLKSRRVEEVMLKVDRAHYCPSDTPYNDAPHSIDYGATISAPHMHAFALEALKDKLVDGAQVLDVGSGSGYLTACLAHMVGPNGVAYGIDHIEQLVEQSKKNLERDNKELLTTGRVKLILADGRVGLPDTGPFDVIHVGATAPELPEQLIGQLKEGGLMVLPVQRGAKQMFEIVEKSANGELVIKKLLEVRYVPLTDVLSQLSGKLPD